MRTEFHTQLRRILGVAVTAAALCVVQVSPSFAEGDEKAAKAEEKKADKIEKVGPGEINWTKKTLKVTGTGAPDLKAPNVAVARIGAERVAKMDALRNVLETIKGVQITAGKSVGKSMESDSGLATTIQGKVKNWKVVDTRYYADGGVELDVEVNLDGEMGKMLLPDTGKKHADLKKKGGSTDHTGIIFDARGLGLVPALAPRIYDDKGNMVFGPSLVSPDAAKDGGVAVYVANLDAAKSADRAGKNPMVLKASAISKTAKSDLVVAAGDAEPLSDMGGLIVDGKVVIVAD